MSIITQYSSSPSWHLQQLLSHPPPVSHSRIKFHSFPNRFLLPSTLGPSPAADKGSHSKRLFIEQTTIIRSGQHIALIFLKRPPFPTTNIVCIVIGDFSSFATHYTAEYYYVLGEGYREGRPSRANATLKEDCGRNEIRERRRPHRVCVVTWAFKELSSCVVDSSQVTYSLARGEEEEEGFL